MRFHGAITALVTPFKNGKIDEPALVKIVKNQIANGIDGLVPVGTTGESPTLTHEEHMRVIRVVVETAAGKVPVIAGTGSNSTDEAVSLTKYAKKVGADGALLAAPYYNKPTQEGLYRHYAAVAKAADFPIVLYNIPGRSVVNIAPETVARLAKIDNIVAIKEASGSMDQASHIMTLCNIDILSGDDSLTLPLMSLGGKGVISVLSNVLPKDVSGLVDAYFAGDHDRARRMHLKLFSLCRAMFIETNPIPIKRAMKLLGFCSDELRLPLCSISDSNERLLVKAMQDYGLKVKA
jgi:4-hydroxy-tetrahydrodipicolinate synthase